MATRQDSRRLVRTADIGALVAEGRRRTKASQEKFAERVGISRKTLSDLERGVADHVSLKTVIKALSLAGFVLEASPRRPPSLSEVMAQRAEHQARVDRFEVVVPPEPPQGVIRPKNTPRPKRRASARKRRRT